VVVATEHQIIYPGGGTAKPLNTMPDIMISANSSPENYDSVDPVFNAFWVGHFLAEH
jgi:hypothetical protein